MKCLSRILIGAALAAVAIPATAAFDAYLQIEGTKQGKFKGAGRSKSSQLPAVRVSEAIVSPRDPQSGLPTGQRMHKPLVVTFESQDIAELDKALASHEELKSVVIHFVTSVPGGKVRHSRTVTLTNAKVVSIKLIKHAGGYALGAPSTLAEVGFEYGGRVSVLGDGSVRNADAWMQ